MKYYIRFQGTTKSKFKTNYIFQCNINYEILYLFPRNNEIIVQKSLYFPCNFNYETYLFPRNNKIKVQNSLYLPM